MKKTTQQNAVQTKNIEPADITICDSTSQMITKARKDGVELAFDRAANMKPCPIGAKSACCKHCAMGPCRINAKDPYAKVGICGATIDTIQSRNLARMVACGTAAHVSHGRNMLNLFKGVVTGAIKDFEIKDTIKLASLAQTLNIETENRSVQEIALDICDELEKIFVQTEGEFVLTGLVPPKTLETWRKLDIVPGGAMLEVMELLQRTHAGMDQDYENLTAQISRTALVDGWGGSMVATALSDILFGTPTPVSAEVDMGCLKEDHVNIIIHGHEPYLVESMVASVNDPSLIKIAQEYGASGINLVGMCCSGLEMLSRHGVPHAGNFMSTEAVLVTGAVDAFGVDVQCIQQSLVSVGECYGTQIFTTNPSCRIEGAEHIEFDEHNARACTDAIVEKAIAIGQYFVASGVYTVFGITFPIVEDTKFQRLLFENLEAQGVGKWGYTRDPYEMAHMMIAHIDKKRKALGIDKARERTLVDMADRRELAAV